MRVLIFHGYLLAGTGSNVYTASVARTLAAAGHQVELLCQDREAESLEWVRQSGGAIRIHRPDIGRLLPVYVEDAYEGFEARAYPRLSDAEIEDYIAANVAAVRALANQAPIDAALANHLVMGPVILARAGLRYAVKIHGSALSYTVRPNRERFGGWAREGLEGASAVLVGSRHTAESLWETIDDPRLEAKTCLGPPGVDLDLFRPLESGVQRRAAIEGLAERMARSDEAGFGRDAEAAPEALRRFAALEGGRVLFVGKLIVSKGVDLLLAAWPMVAAAHRGAGLLLVGFGEYRAGVERMIAAMAAGDLEAMRTLAARGRELEGGEPTPLPILSAFLADPPGDYLSAARSAAGSIQLSGRLTHDEVGALVPASDALVFPSTFPEAFGMVAAEAAGAGVLPICADHSGITEVAGALRAGLEPAVAGLVSFDLDDDPVGAIASRLNSWLEMPIRRRADAGESMRAIVADRWSWKRVAEVIVQASAGDLAGIPRP